MAPEAGGYLQLFKVIGTSKRSQKRDAPLVTAVSRSWAPSDGPAATGLHYLSNSPKFRRCGDLWLMVLPWGSPSQDWLVVFAAKFGADPV